MNERLEENALRFDGGASVASGTGEAETLERLEGAVPNETSETPGAPRGKRGGRRWKNLRTTPILTADSAFFDE